MRNEPINAVPPLTRSYRRNVWSCLAASSLIATAAVCAEEVVRTVPPLPAGAHPVWDMGKAWKISSERRESICVNGLWRFRSAADMEPASRVFSDDCEKEPSAWAKSGDLKCAVVKDAAVRKSGAASTRFDIDIAPRVNFFHITRQVEVKPSKNYELKAWVKTELEAGHAALEVQDTRNRFDGDKKIFLVVAGEKLKGKSEWRQLVIPFTAPEGAEKIRILVRSYEDPAGCKGSFWLDDVRLEEKRNDFSEAKPPADPAWGYAKVPGNPKGTSFTTYWNESDPLRQKPAELLFAWYQRPVAIPAEWGGRRITLRIERVSTEAYVYVDGARAGKVGDFGGEVDLTPFVKPGATATLSVLVHAMSPEEVSEFFSERGMEDYQKHRGSCGFTGDVFLDSAPAAAPRIGPFQIVTSVKDRTITVKADLDGAGAAEAMDVVSLRCEVKDGGKMVKSFSAPLKKGASSVEASADWPEAELWDIGKPKLYEMRVSVAKGDQIVDQALPERFGFREFEIKGKFFHLNGVKVNLRPASFAVGRECWLGKDEVDRWFVKALEQNHNFLYVESVDAPNQLESLKIFLDACDERGILAAVTPTQINKFQNRINEPQTVQWLEERYNTRAHRVWNHPSLVMYRMNMNLCCYEQDQNPLLLDGKREPPEDTGLGKKFAALEKSSQIMKSIDKTRPTYQHACGNAGDVYTLNNYLCWPDRQDLREWLYVWAADGVKPMMMVEFDLPYPGSFSLNDPSHWWSNEPMVPEYGAILLGAKSYDMIEDDYLDFVDFAWNRKDKKWESAYGYYCTAYPKIIDECSSLYYEIVLPAWRTWGISGGLNSWENSRWRLVKRPAKPSLGNMRERIPEAPLATDWEKLQRPGFAADLYTYDCRGCGEMKNCSFPGLPSEKPYIEPVRRWDVIKEQLAPLYAHIAGPEADWPERDHAYYVGETIKKSVVLVNDLRAAALFKVEWKFEADGKIMASGKGEAQVKPAETAQLAIAFAAPDVAAKTAGTLSAVVTVDGRSVPVASFALQIHPKMKQLAAAPAGWAIFDPKGLSSKGFDRIGLDLKAFSSAQPSKDVKTLVIGAEALDDESAAAVIAALPGLLDAGAQILILEQTPAALEKFFGLRAFTRAPRQLWIRDAAHPFAKGLVDADFADWRGKTSLGPIDGPPKSMTDNQRWKRAWRCSQRGVVASTIVEKPHLGSFHPILDGEFDLRYMALWEVAEGAGRLVFCQADVSDRLGREPAADRLVANILDSLRSGEGGKKVVKTAIVASDAWIADLLKLRLDAELWPSTPPKSGLLVFGGGSGSWILSNRKGLGEFLASGGDAVAIGLQPEDADALSFIMDGSFATAVKRVSDAGSLAGAPAVFAAASPGDCHWRERQEMVVVTAVPQGGWMSSNGALAAVPVGKGRIVWIAAAPAVFDPERRPDLILSKCNVSRLAALVLCTMGARSRHVWSSISRHEKSPELVVEGVWRARKDDKGIGASEGLMKIDADEKSGEWRDMSVPGQWGECHPDWAGFLGDVWYRHHFKAPEQLKGAPLEFFASAIDDTDEIWLNGVKIGQTTKETPGWWGVERHYRIPAGLLKFDGADNVIAARVNNNYLDSGFIGRVALQAPPVLGKSLTSQYLDVRLPRDDPYAQMRW